MGAGNPNPACCSKKANLPTSGEKVPRAPSRPRAPKATPIYGSLPSDGRFRTWNCPKGAFKSSSIMPIAIPPCCASELAQPAWASAHTPPGRSGDLASQEAFRPRLVPRPNGPNQTASREHPPAAINRRMPSIFVCMAGTQQPPHACAGPSLGFCFASGRTAGFITRRFNTLFRLRCGWPLNSAPSRVRCRAPQ